MKASAHPDQTGTLGGSPDPPAPDPLTAAARPSALFRLWLAARDAQMRPLRFPGEGRRIMVGVDLSPASDAALGLVVGIAAITDTIVDLVHVFDGFREAFMGGNRSLLDRSDWVAATVAAELRARAVAAAAQGARCVSTALEGAPAVELTRHAQKTGADLLVLGLGPPTTGPLGAAWSSQAAAQLLRGGSWHERPLSSPGYFWT